MERLKKMDLKKALFTIALVHIVAALLLSLLVFWGCLELSSAVAPQGVLINVHSDPVTITELPNPTRQGLLLADLLSVLQIALPLLICTMALLSTASLFYQVKLKSPLTALTEGASRIMDQDLDFTVEAHSPDELGQLCQAFETMRRTLLSNNQELWRQAEERKRLNAAFAHNLRNPVTVLKGSVKVMKRGMEHHTMSMEQMEEQMSLLKNYTDRIERYIETMSRVQKLEEIPLARESVEWNVLMAELRQGISLMSADRKPVIPLMETDSKPDVPLMETGSNPDIPPDIQFEAAHDSGYVLVDTSILFQIAENLVSNALRFASRKIFVSCSADDGILTFSVADDGRGFPAALLKKGIQPFQRGNEEAEHFGMGLYSSMLLARKHGGNVEIRNGQTGAVVTARVNIR